MIMKQRYDMTEIAMIIAFLSVSIMALTFTIMMVLGRIN